MKWNHVPSITDHTKLDIYTPAGLWNIVTLGMAKGSEPKVEVCDTLLANQSLLLILVLTNHCTSVKNMPNPYREALFSFTNSQGLMIWKFITLLDSFHHY